MLRFRASALSLSVVLALVLGTQSASAFIKGHEPKLKSVSVTPFKVVGGSNEAVTGMVTLNEPADVGGEVVTLTSRDHAAATVPASVTIAEGSTTATFTVSTSQVFSDRRAMIRAEMGRRHRECELRIRPFEVKSFAFNPSTVVGGSIFSGGQTTVGTVTISAPAGPAGLTVQLTSNGSGSAPPTLTVPSGATSISFTLIPPGVTHATRVKFVAAVGCSHESAILNIVPPGG